MGIEEIKKDIKEEIDSVIMHGSTDLTQIVEDAENYCSLCEIETIEELDKYFDEVVFNLSNYIEDLQDIQNKYEELWQKYVK